ncbi:hypothetical protein KM043_009142 [Ampulex compressa]|nr:hypothetical protein KM043_009142 [Ampulex compressa]
MSARSTARCQQRVSRAGGRRTRVASSYVVPATVCADVLYLHRRTPKCRAMSEEPSKYAIDGILPFLQSIEWRDPWLAILLTFHIAVTMTALMTRNHANFQIMLFLALLLLVYFSESINEVAASNWMMFSRQQYFDSNGLFISVVFSVPILMNCMIMIASWLYQSSQLMTSLKRAQLRQQARNRHIDGEPKNANGNTVRQKQE